MADSDHGGEFFPWVGDQAETSEVLSNSKSMNSLFLFSKQKASECFSCLWLTLPAKANRDMNAPKFSTAAF